MKKDIDERLKEFGEGLKVKDEIMYFNKKKIMIGVEKKRNFAKPAMIIAASLLVAFSVLTATALSFPAFAKTVAPGMPLVKTAAEKEQEVEALSEEIDSVKEAVAEKDSEIDSLKEEIEGLEMKIKEISDELIKEVQTSDNEDEKQNLQLQTLVIEFVKKMYNGEFEAAAGYCTEEFADTVLNRPEDILMRTESTTVVFTQITNIAKLNDETYLVFLRLNDSGEAQEADHQLDFEIKAVDDGYLISFVGLDA